MFLVLLALALFIFILFRGAATKLGVPRQTLESKIRKLGINQHHFLNGLLVLLCYKLLANLGLSFRGVNLKM
jgi:hypothetical protein